MDKIRVLVLFGGQSSEHEISEISATNILNNLDERVEPTMVGITMAGEWFLYEGNIADIKGCGWEKSPYLTPAILSPDATHGGLLVFERNGSVRRIEIDVVYPALHGKYGEDGTIQGLCELAGIPCVGPSMLSSAICMDKTVAKIYFEALGIPQAKWVTVHSFDLEKKSNAILDEIEEKLGYPVFVKPANAGSSVGIGKAKNRETLLECLFTAADYDRKILVEEFIKGREIESAAIGNRKVKIAEPGEVVSCNEFYDFEAKYQEPSTIEIPANIDQKHIDKIKEYAKTLFLGLGLTGLSRLDFFVTDEDEVKINEINTLPGFTDISMYPKMMEHIGFSQQDLVFELITLAIDEFVGYEEE